jgi:hypothetical protein
MIPDDIDPSLRAGEPLLESLEDGFSPPAREAQQQHGTGDADAALPPELALGTKSPF